MRLILLRLIVSAVVVVTAASCGGDSTAPLTLDEQLTIVNRPNSPDTISARPAQALVVRVRNPDGGPRVGTIVRFNAVPAGDPKRPFEVAVSLASLVGNAYTALVVDSVNASGTAAALVGFGTIAGPARITVSVPELGITDTVTFTVNPGGPARLTLAVRDTTVLKGASYAIGATVVDRVNNPLPGATVQYTAGPSVASVDTKGTLVAGEHGRGYVVVRSGVAVDTSRISVVPSARLVVFRYNTTAHQVAFVNVDGTEYTPVATSTDSYVAPRSTNSGSLVTYYGGSPGFDSRVFVLDVTTGVMRTPFGSVTSPSWPTWSADGSWIYFLANRNAGGRGVFRAHPDGTGVATIGPTVSATFPAPAVSPDGRTVAVEDGGSLILIDVATSVVRRLAVSCPLPQFSPDGQRIACQTVTALSVINQDGATVRTFPGSFSDIGGPDWSPDGIWIVAMGSVSGFGFGSPILIRISDGVVIPLTRLSPGFLQVAFVR